MHLTAREVNERNHQFWLTEGGEFHRLIETNPSLLEEALCRLQGQIQRMCPIYAVQTPEAAIKEVVGDRARHYTEWQRGFSQKGVTARKPDQLSSLIDDRVRQRPQITASELLIWLKTKEKISCIAEINDEEIVPYKGEPVRIRALKDRLYRARKKYESRNR